MNRRPNTAWIGFCINALYGIYTGILGVAGRSWWFVALAAYYIVLAVTRFAVLLSMKHSPAETERFISRFIGAMCIFLAVTMAGVTFLSFQADRGVRHHEIVMISIAVYAFTKISLAIIGMVQSWKGAGSALKCLRNLSLTDAAVSIFALQRSMLVSFAGMSAANVQLMNALTGTAVYLFIALLGINLMGGKKITMAKSKIVAANEKIAEAVTGGYKKIESGVVGGYKKIEEGVVSGYTKIEDKFIDQFLTREGETVEEARRRLKGHAED